MVVAERGVTGARLPPLSTTRTEAPRHGPPAAQQPRLPFALHVSTARVWRGAENQILQTLLGLRRHGARAALAAQGDGELYRRLEKQPDVHALRTRGEWDVAAAWRLGQFIRRLRPAILHVHEPHGVALGAMAAQMAGKSRPLLVLSRHVVWGTSRNAFSRWKYGSVDAFFANCQAGRRQLIADGIPSERVSVIHEGVDIERIAAATAADVKAAFGLPPDALVIGSVAALAPEKGLEHLIDAAALVVKAIPQARFVICGDGELRQRLEQRIARLDLQEHVVLAGFRTDVPQLLKGFDLYVVSSLQEALCTSLIDAMAASRSAVATAVGGIPEVVIEGETGVLVPPADPQATAARIVELLRDEDLRRRMGAAGMRRARELFGAEEMIRKTLLAYQRLLAVQ